MNCTECGRKRTGLTRGSTLALALETVGNKEIQSGHLLNKRQQRRFHDRRWALSVVCGVQIQSRKTIQWRALISRTRVCLDVVEDKADCACALLGLWWILVSCLPPAVLELTGNPFQETMHARKSRLYNRTRGCQLTRFCPFCCNDYRQNDDSGDSQQMAVLKI